MPMFRGFVPRKLQPWIYLFMAFTFQFSGGLYLGNLNEMTGSTTLMRENLLMCLYANLAGMAIYFPLLFRMKFRFTNKTLLTSAISGILACNLAVPHITFLPLLWALCFFEGMCKIQGTFECMSNIQLWMTPERDFSVFFPVLHIVILGSMQLSDLCSVYLMHHYHWNRMHYFIAGLMCIDLCIVTFLTRHFRMFKKMPLFGIDWLGGVLWAVLLLQVSYFFCYGDWLDWFHSPVMHNLAVSILFTLALCLWRMCTIRHPFLEPQMWRYRNLLPVLFLITVVEALLATEHVLEEIFYEEVMHYENLVSVQFNWFTLTGALTGCAFAWWWLHIKRFNSLRLIAIGFAAIVAYYAGFYFTLSSEIHWTQLAVPVACRGFAYAVLSITFMLSLEDLMSFQHFFQSLSVFNMLHMVVGGVMGAALYTQGFSYYVADNMARYGAALDHVSANEIPGGMSGFMPQFVEHVMQISLKQMFGWALFAGIAVCLCVLLYDAPVRRRFKIMPLWRSVWKDVRRTSEKSSAH